jgi:hypothetical protein
VKVLALEGHVLDLQRQLQQLELQRTNERRVAGTYMDPPCEPDHVFCRAGLRRMKRQS